MLRQILRGHRSNGSSSLLITQYEMPFINKSETTKRSKDRQMYGKCTNGTIRRSRVWAVCFIYSVASQPSFIRSLVFFFFLRSSPTTESLEQAVYQTTTPIRGTGQNYYTRRGPTVGREGGGGLSPIFEHYQQHFIGF